MSVIGFIGLGNMGGHMARNLMKNGKKLIVFDVNKSVTEKFRAEGCQVVQHPADIAAATKEIITVLPSTPHVKQVYTNDNGIFSTIQPGTLCMDCSTIDQVMNLEVAQLAQKKKAEYIDAPISGGVTGAENATLTFMVGAGGDKTFERAKAILALMGKNIVNLGAVGNGQAAKICNNMLLGVQMIAVAEAMNLGQSMGLNAKDLAGIINTSSGRCWASDTYNPVPGVIEGNPSGRGYAGGFGTSLMAKDLSLAQNASTNAQVPTPLGSVAHQLYRLLARDPHYQAKDFGVVYQFLKKSNV